VHAFKQIRYDRLQTPRSLLWNQRGLLEEEGTEELCVLFGTVGLHAPSLELPAGEGKQIGEEEVLFVGLQPKDLLHILPYLPLQFSNIRRDG